MKPDVEFKDKSRPARPDVHCYNCGNKNHKSTNCKNEINVPLILHKIYRAKIIFKYFKLCHDSSTLYKVILIRFLKNPT